MLESGKIKQSLLAFQLLSFNCVFLTLLLFVLTYHMFTEVFARLWKKLKERERNIDADVIMENLIDYPPNNVNQNDKPGSEPTFTIISDRDRSFPGAPGAPEVVRCVDGTKCQDDNEDATLTISVDSHKSAPLLVEGDI